LKRNISDRPFSSNSTMPSPISLFDAPIIFQRQYLSTEPLKMFKSQFFHTYLTNPLRWRHANDHQPYIMAHNRRCNRSSTRMVPRPCYCILLHEPRIRYRRTRRRSTQHVFPHGSRLPNRWPKQEPIPRHILSSSSATAGEYNSESWG
jgi:hypothetical protein